MPQHIPTAIDLALSATRAANLELQPTKIQMWTASCTNSTPPAFLDKAKLTLKWGNDNSPVEQGAQPSINTATRRFKNISAIMR